MCGVSGIICKKNGDCENQPDVIAKIYDSLVSIQHRGQDSAGIITYDSKTFHLKKGLGLVQDIFTPKNISRLKGGAGLGHVRYPTVGHGTGEDAQPFYLNAPFGIALVHNGNVVNYHPLKEEIEKKDHRMLSSGCDAELILNVLADEMMKHDLDNLGAEDLFAVVEGIFKRADGAYSVIAFIAEKGMLAFRDPHGIKPLIYARKKTENETCTGFFSESVAADMLGFEERWDVKPGEAVFVDTDQNVIRKQVATATHTPCIFEWIYFARPDSLIDDISVYRTRRRLGKELAKEWKKMGLKVDVVIPVPDSARSAALAFSHATGIPYREGFVKNRYVGRTFIMPRQEKRKDSIRAKLNTIKMEFKDKNVLIMDDSIVRGNTSKAIVQMARNAGAKKVYFASYSAPLKYPCVYGIDMSTKEDFVAIGRSIDEIAEVIGADKVIYQTIEGMVNSATKGNRKINDYCLACFNGHYPTGDIREFLEQIEAERRMVHGCGYQED